MNITNIGEGKVYLLAGGGKCFTDIAARFCRSERPALEIADSPYSAKLVRHIIDSGHLAAAEFDHYIFAVEGYSRVTEAQLIRKRHASYLIKSGRGSLGAKRAYNIVLPEHIRSKSIDLTVESDDPSVAPIKFDITVDALMKLNENMYNALIEQGVPDEEARFIKPQATEFRAIVGMNAHALLDWFGIRCCNNAQTEIRDMAWKMLKLVREVSPDIFKDAGPRCKQLGYCPETAQNKKCVGKVLNRAEAMARLRA